MTASSPLHVLHVTTATELDQHFFAGFIKHGRHHLLSQSLWTWGPSGTLHAAFAELGGSVKSYDGKSLIGASLSLARFIRDVRPQLVHAHLYRASVVAAIVRRLHGLPVLVTTRHYSDQHFIRGRLRHVYADRFVARSSDLVVGVSPYAASVMVEREGLDARCVQVIEVGLDIESVLAARQRFQTAMPAKPKHVQTLVTIMKPDRLKGLDILAAAFAQVRRWVPGIELRVVGVSPMDSIAVPTPGITYLGWVDGVFDLLMDADVYVHPSRSEACCQALLEAIALGVPVVATETGNAREVVGYGVGELVPPGEADALARAVLRVLARRSPHVVPNWADTKFDNRVSVAAYRRVYDSVLAKHAASPTSWSPAETGVVETIPSDSER